jgi:hypothetical protein
MTRVQTLFKHACFGTDVETKVSYIYLRKMGQNDTPEYKQNTGSRFGLRWFETP